MSPSQSSLLSAATSEVPRRMTMTGDTLWGVSPVPVNVPAHKQNSRQHQLTSKFLHSVWPSCYKPPVKLLNMDVKETAVWVGMLAVLKGWNEARTYSEVFKVNDISGYMLPILSVQTLKVELNIDKLGHRLEIITAIKDRELTLVNPVIVSLCPDRWFRNFVSQEKYGDVQVGCKLSLEEEQMDSKLHELEVMKWFSGSKINPVLYTNRKVSFSSKSFSPYLHSYSNHASSSFGMHMFNHPTTKMTGDLYAKGKQRNAISSCSKFSWIPPIELPQSALECIEEKSKVEFGRWFEEHPSSMFSSTKQITDLNSLGLSNKWDADGGERKN